MEETKSRSVEDILLRENYITKEQLKEAEKYAIEKRTSVIDYLIEKGIITGDLFGQAMAEAFGVTYADLNSYVPPREQILEIPERIAKKYRVVLFKKEKGIVKIATDNPDQKNLSLALKPIFGESKISILYSLSEDIDAVFINYRKALKTRFVEILRQKGKSVASKIVDEIIEDALVYNASDIHIEPQTRDVLIRFRVDGVLQEAGRIPKDYYENIINRIKVQAQLRTDEHFTTQDGAIRYVGKGRQSDIRISIAPTINGEKVVMRVLSEYVSNFSMSNLGLSPEDQKTLEEAIKKPFGMILVTGPTGSGKTTTLYSFLRILNKPDVNISTIEDPVEYKMENVNQIQVNVQKEITFSRGLRSIVRQDPDIILVGEIRDIETAELGVNAALTGHLFFSTFHANDAATTIPRLLDMDTEPFLLASTLELVVAQRLVRRICENCRYSYKEESENIKGLESYGITKSKTFYKGKGCSACNGTGYHGRIAVFEMIKVTPQMEDLMLQNPSSKQIWDLAKSQGSKSLFEDGIEKVKSGVTTLEELRRIASPVEY